MPAESFPYCLGSYLLLAVVESPGDPDEAVGDLAALGCMDPVLEALLPGLLKKVALDGVNHCLMSKLRWLRR